MTCELMIWMELILTPSDWIIHENDTIQCKLDIQWVTLYFVNDELKINILSWLLNDHFGNNIMNDNGYIIDTWHTL